MRYLIFESETAEDREARRESVGRSAGESFAATLRDMVPGCETQLIDPAGDDAESMSTDAVARFDAVFVGGSPLHVYEDAPEVRRQLAFMRLVFAAGTPSFGSCAGLQIAAAAAGGQVRPLRGPREAGMARRIVRTPERAGHPLLEGRPAVWEAATIHGDEVAALPEGARVLAINPTGQINAAEIRHDRGVFWGVKYHPELSPGEIGAALRRSAETLTADGLARSRADVDAQADLFDRLHQAPSDRSAMWRLGVNDDYADADRRRLELRNFLSWAGRLRHAG